jgi:hypothetical protein
MPDDLDAEATTMRMMTAVRAHYQRFDKLQSARVFEVLNALASTAAVVLSAIETEQDQQQARDWFTNALREELADLKQRAQGPTI